MEEKNLAWLLRPQIAGDLKRRWGCPDDTQLAAYVDAQLLGPDRERLERHLADCDFCLSQVAALLRLQDAELPVEVPARLLARAAALVDSGARPVLRPAWRWAGVAAATACLAMIATLWWQRLETVEMAPPSRVRPPATLLPPPKALEPVAPAATLRAARKAQKGAPAPQLLYPREGAVVPPGEAEFRWKEVRGSLFYQIRVVTAEGDVVWEGRVEATHVRLPHDVQLVAGQKFFVSVRAFLPEGKTVTSGVVGFKTRHKS